MLINTKPQKGTNTSLIIKMKLIKAAQVGTINSNILYNNYLPNILTLSLLKCRFQLYR